MHNGPAEGPDRVEAQLREIWSGFLGRDDFPADRSFFELGGNSMDLIRMVVAAGRLGAELDYEKFLADPTLANLAALFRAGGAGGAGQDAAGGQTSR
ncbi:MAG TPA: acyl carrier protein [Allosphingosinicella sp.]|jgi:acyl carrier protein